MPALPDPNAPIPDDELLNFDDLLDIAKEYEFTRTITHLWPCEDDSAAFPETELEDMLATMAPSHNPEEIPLPTPADSTNAHPDALHRPTDANGSIAVDPVSRPKKAKEAPPTSTLHGWSPPDGSQYLELVDSLMLPQSSKDFWVPPWLAVFLSESPFPAKPVDDGPPGAPPRSTKTQTQTVKAPQRVSTTKDIKDEPAKENLPLVPSPPQPSIRASREPVRARPALKTDPSQTATTARAKRPKSRRHSPSSTTANSATSGTKYAKPPRGGIPPHIARSVTKANILRVEKERKVFHDAMSTTTTGHAKKPSVLREAGTVEKEYIKMVNGGASRKKLSNPNENGQREGRAVKRARV